MEQTTTKLDQDETLRMTPANLDALKITARRQGFNKAIRVLYENGFSNAAQTLEKLLSEAPHV